MRLRSVNFNSCFSFKPDSFLHSFYLNCVPLLPLGSNLSITCDLFRLLLQGKHVQAFGSLMICCSILCLPYLSMHSTSTSLSRNVTGLQHVQVLAGLFTFSGNPSHDMQVPMHWSKDMVLSLQFGNFTRTSPFIGLHA